ncbi:MAG TPA: hypothetical protein VK420_06815, partial [Longimicrobium sp.]|nr:hypothetical protein [Longimicrobium sp.]
MRASLLLLSAALGCALAGCAANAFSAAKKADTAEAYRGFLREYPKDDNAEPAQARLADLEFERAQKLHTVLGYKRYLEEFPDSAGAYK